MTPSSRRLAGRLLLAVLCAASAAHGGPAADPDAATFKQVCGGCHNTDLAVEAPRSYEGWYDTVQTMIDRGARGSDAQFQSVMTYLYRNLTTIDVNEAEAEDLVAVLHATPQVAEAVIARRATRRFTDLADLKTVPGLDFAVLDAQARLIFF